MTYEQQDRRSGSAGRLLRSATAVLNRTRRLRDRVKITPSITRELIASQYLAGSGLEVGALHNPLRVPKGLQVRYVDFEAPSDLDAHYPELGNQRITQPDLISDLETLRGVADGSQDFVIANHVLEHCEDPIKAMKSVARVLRNRGIAYLAIPDKRYTFDVDRNVTSLEHLIADHEQGPDVSLRSHYRDWCRNVDKLSEPELSEKVALLLAGRVNIHFHVWEYAQMLEFFHYVTSELPLSLSVELSYLTGNEVIWILRKHPAESEVSRV